MSLADMVQRDGLIQISKLYILRAAFKWQLIPAFILTGVIEYKLILVDAKWCSDGA